jgi:hypothetical protein
VHWTRTGKPKIKTLTTNTNKSNSKCFNAIVFTDKLNKFGVFLFWGVFVQSSLDFRGWW